MYPIEDISYRRKYQQLPEGVQNEIKEYKEYCTLSLHVNATVGRRYKIFLSLLNNSFSEIPKDYTDYALDNLSHTYSSRLPDPLSEGYDKYYRTSRHYDDSRQSRIAAAHHHAELALSNDPSSDPSSIDSAVDALVKAKIDEEFEKINTNNS